MAQPRDPKASGRRQAREELSDLSEVKALAAKARSETGGPILSQNAAELSGVRPRRDSVVGMRLTPPPRATTNELPNWFWGALGCLSVLLVGFAGLVVLGRSGKLNAILGEAPAAATVAVVPAPPSAPAPAATEPSPAAAPSPTVQELQPRPAAEAEPAARHVAAREHDREREPTPVPAPKPVAKSAEAAEPEQAAPGNADNNANANANANANNDNGNGTAETPPPKAPTAAAGPTPRLARAPATAAAPKAAPDDTDDDQAAPGQDAVEAALDALSSRVRGCFVKYQIKGTARVRLVATSAGTAESVNVTGDFEDTPTGLCVEAVVSGAKLPTFKGPSLKLSQSYQLR